MDRRTTLGRGEVISFPGMVCEIEYLIGKGSNAVVYKGKYYDGLNEGLCHHVLIKEMFPYHPKGLIYRGENGEIVVHPDGKDVFDLHKHSFECGNRVHLNLLERYPDRIGANLNSFSQNGTLYTVMGYDGGRSLDFEFKGGANKLRDAADLMIDILDALDVFHSSGYLHLDISPDNVLRVGEGKFVRTYLIDYNSVHRIDELRSGRALYCSAKEGYTAPEVRHGELSSIGFTSDIYSAAAVFYWLLMGKAPSAYQLMCKNPPDARDSRLLDGAPETVSAMVRQILRRGLSSTVSRRYKDTEQMKADISELIDRIDGVGITHASLWEAGQRNVVGIIKQNPALRYITDEAELYPLRVADKNGNVQTVREVVDECTRDGGASFVLRAPGGMGKTTALLHTAISMNKGYSPASPAYLYVSLYDWNDSGDNFIRNRILENLKFKPDVTNLEDARRRLGQVLNKPVVTKNGNVPGYILLIDGLNEASGDTTSLFSELELLSKKKGTRVICTTRSTAEELPLPCYELSPLTRDDISNALSEKGLLLPENEEMQRHLSTPLLLSVFIKTAENSEKQIAYENPNELLSAYFDSLCLKETKDLPENAPQKWTAEVAVRLVLPSICGEISRKKHSLNKRELLAVVEKCWKTVSSRGMVKIFPEWIGHSKDICGGARHSEEWYGMIVRNLLWYRMGLLVKDSTDGYRIVHQNIEAYLNTLDRANQKKIRAHRNVNIAAGFCASGLAVLLGVFMWNFFIKPQPYNEEHTHTLLSGAVIAQSNMSGQVDGMLDVIDAQSPSEYEIYESVLRSRIQYNSMLCSSGLTGSPEWAEDAFDRMTESGKVMPWSGEKLNEWAYTELFAASERGVEEYARYLDILSFLNDNPSYDEKYGDKFRSTLTELIETDAEISDVLYKLVLSPHLSAMEKDQPDDYKYYIEALGKAIDISDNEPEECNSATLESLLARRREKQIEISASELFTIYERTNKR